MGYPGGPVARRHPHPSDHRGPHPGHWGAAWRPAGLGPGRDPQPDHGGSAGHGASGRRAVPHEEAVGAITRMCWTERLAVDAEVVRRAVERGEIDPVDPEHVIEAVLGPPYFHLLVTDRPVSDDFLVATVDLVVRGLRR
ncbi:TetR-like C-terminal domain-containing protein [Saccharothrix sp. ALI-22-I]|uniref:TetR-like C-terminal domain-containing protein n=1 Tax=Saccharothrix sp. ALI-22-I TaxID=1933778 RepID=UPI0023780D01|nr:TetR-like C-terminal domain-containing protein [Saccharothrix sp. ALI-22-I]